MTVAAIRRPEPQNARSITVHPFHHAADEAYTAMARVAEYVAVHDSDACLMVGRERVTLEQMQGVITMAAVGSLPSGLTIFTSTVEHRDALAEQVRAAFLRGIGEYVASPGGMPLLIRAQATA